MLKVTALALFAAFLGAEAAAAQTMTLTSPDLASGTFATQYILNGFGCTGGNISPAVTWSNPPAGTKSFVLNVFDPDAPTGSGFWHWAVYNIPATATGLARGAGNSPATRLRARCRAEPILAFPATAAPARRKAIAPHHYHFTIFAVDTPKLDGDENNSAAFVGFQLHFHTLAKAELIGVWGH